jgi:hypothetical protein
MDNILVNWSGSAGGFIPADEFGEWVVRELKAMIKSNAACTADEFHRKIVSPQILSLREVRLNITRDTHSTDYGQRSSSMKAFADVRTIADRLINDDVFHLIPGRTTLTQAKNLYGDGCNILEKGEEVQALKSILLARAAEGIEEEFVPREIFVDMDDDDEGEY